MAGGHLRAPSNGGAERWDGEGEAGLRGGEEWGGGGAAPPNEALCNRRLDEFFPPNSCSLLAATSPS